MDPLTIGASIAAVKAAVGAASDVKEIGGALQKLLADEDEHEKNKKNPSQQQPKSRNQQIVRRRTGEDVDAYADETSISSVAADVLAEKQNELNRQGLAREIDRKWGLGTWEAIQNERTKRLKAKAEREETEKKQRRKKKDQLDKLIHKILVEGGKALIIISALLGMIYFLIWAAEKGGSA